MKVEYTSGIRVEDYTEWLSGQYLLGQEPDVMVILPEDFVIFSDTASLRELDPFMKQDPEADLSGFYPAALQAGADKGKQYALPLECVPQMMFINKTLLQKEHIRIPDNDWTWDEFYSLCEQLTRDTDGDGIIDQFGVYDYGWEEALVANGCSLFSEDGQHCLLNQSASPSSHSAVEYEDGAVIAQLGTPDMRLPIQYALYYPKRRTLSGKRLDLFELQNLTFERPDLETFQGLGLAMEAMKQGGNIPTAFNAANEKAVALFLNRKISYLEITDIIQASMEHCKFIDHPNVDEILATEQEAYEFIGSRW